MPNSTGTTEAQPLFLSHASGKLHVADCPHIRRVEGAQPATPEQRERNGICSWCQRELAGQGRTTFATLDEALRDFGHVSDQSHRLIREALQGITYDSFWIPSSRSYIGLGLDGLGVAWIGVGYVERKGDTTVELPWFVPSGGGGTRAAEAARGEMCMVHFIEKSVSGLCDDCEGY